METRLLSTAFLLLLLLLLHVAVPATVAADSATMGKLLAAISPSPPGWSSRTYYCKWGGIACDSSSSVTGIDLASMSLSGTLPDLSGLSMLKSVSLQHNSFSGAVPSFAKLRHLSEIFIDYNNFTSVPPGVFEGLTALNTLSMGNNPNLPPWTIPTELKQSAALQTLEISSTNINGTLPDWLGSSLPSLQYLRLSYNKFTGSLPSSFDGSGIKALWMNNQELSGPIDVLSTMTSLEQVWIHVNKFTGPIPDLSKCVNLFDLQLRDNSLTGVVPPGLTSLPSIQNVSLKDNKLQGPVPANPKHIKLTYEDNRFCRTVEGPCDPQVTALLAIEGAFGYPVDLADSWKGNDACSGWDYVTCDGSKVTRVVLSNQKLTGSISPAFGNLTALTVLMLNDNDLTGTIPAVLTKLPRLQVLDVSNNNLSGKIPPFSSSVRLNTSGNPFMGKNIPISSNSTFGTGSSSSTSTSGSGSGSGSGKGKGSGLSIGVIIGIVLAALFLIGVALFLVYKYVYSKKKYRQNASIEDNFGPSSTKNGSQQSNGTSVKAGKNSDFAISENGSSLISMELVRRITNNFSEANIIGKGGFGTVYKGVLPANGVTVAIKRMQSVAFSDKGVNEFQAEIAVLSKVRHRHLVALLGYCINGNERLLVYEYMPQGTLSQYLFDWKKNQYPPLTWLQRVIIALDVARGVEYLHGLAQQSFIHRDLKPSNILLGNDMRAKVSDFGLVKNAPEGKYSVETRLAGTFGYLAPEYAVTGRVTTKVDVFAFGVILMELITGQKALDETQPEDRAHLVTWFRRVLINKESDIAKTVDESLNRDDPETMESIRKVAELAGHCTAREPFQRPDMGHAVNVLSPLVQEWRPTDQAGEEEEDGYYDSANLSLGQVVERWKQNEGNTSTFGSTGDFSYSRSNQSIPSKPSQFGTPDSTNCR